jgi:hypothetical protein
MTSRFSRTVLVLLALILALATGCIFSPERKPPTKTKPVEYLKPDSPTSVLQNLIKSYTERDSVETELVYDPLYEGTSDVPGAPAGGYLFNRTSEVRHVGALKLSRDIVSISLDLGPIQSWQILPGNASDPPDWVIIPIPASTVQINDVANNTVYESVNRVIEYTFKPTLVSGETVWTVVRWRESL